MIFLKGEDIFFWYIKSQKKAEDYGINIFELDYLLSELTDLDSLAIRLKNYRDKEKISSQKTLSELDNLWKLRTEKKYPIQYLIGKCHWRNFELKVTEDVLIPRPETELIIDIAMEVVDHFPELQQRHWADLGTGSGAIALSLAHTLPQAHIHAVDQSQKALTIAQENAHNLDLSKKITFHHGSWFQPLSQLKNSLCGILSNPPYIPSALIPTLQPEVVNHEPKTALDGGTDGLQDVKTIIHQAPAFLINNGLLIIEIMAGQAPQVTEIMASTKKYINIQTHKDLAGIERFVSGQKQ